MEALARREKLVVDGEDAGLVDGRGLCGLEVVRWLVEEDFGNWMV